MTYAREGQPIKKRSRAVCPVTRHMATRVLSIQVDDGSEFMDQEWRPQFEDTCQVLRIPSGVLPSRRPAIERLRRTRQPLRQDRLPEPTKPPTTTATTSPETDPGSALGMMTSDEYFASLSVAA